MMKPLPCSHSALVCHDNCPEQYHHKYVLKDLPPEAKSSEQLWGTFVHTEFELYLSRPGRELPPDLLIHRPVLDKLITDGEADGCFLVAEQKVALSTKMQPCGYFEKSDLVSLFWCGVIDAHVIDKVNARARIVDYKTGKKKEDWDQLAQNAIWIFQNYPSINLINAQFYWVTDQTVSKRVWARTEMDTLYTQGFGQRVLAYAHSFKTDTWPKKQSGLCKGWCPVTTCQFWEPKKEKYR